MAYMHASGGEPVPAEQIRIVARLSGIVVPEEDLEALSTALRDQLALAQRLETLDLDGIAPSVRFSAGWHD